MRSGTERAEALATAAEDTICEGMPPYRPVVMFGSALVPR
jgi:hypothetical protein